MAEALLSAHPADDTSAESARKSIGQRKQKLARTLEAKVAQGYRIESQSDTQAVLRMRKRPRWFGLLKGTTMEYDIAVDERGHASSRRRG